MAHARTRWPDRATRRPTLVRAALVVGAWTGVGLFSLSQASLDALATGDAPPGPLSAARMLVDVWMWAAFTPAILRLGGAVPLARAAWVRPALFHAAASLAFAAADVVLDHALAPLLGPAPAPPLDVAFVRQAFVNVSSYWVVLALGRAATDRRLSHARKIRAAELEAQLSDARLRALEMQLQPHFLFNALHTIAALVRRSDRTRAIRTIAQLGDLLRDVLRGGDAQEVPLREELAFVERYLAIEASRFGDRLAVEIASDPSLGGALVPRLLLQPLVENAVRHGIEPLAAPGHVAVRAAREGDVLRIEVQDTGPGPASASRAGGVGLANTRARLAQLYGDRHRLALEAAPGGGAVARIELPWREEEEVRRAG